jgi:hypothetical protein
VSLTNLDFVAGGVKTGREIEMPRVQTRISAALLAVFLAGFACEPAAAAADHKCDPVSDPGWNVLPSDEVTGESDSAPYSDASRNWFVDRTTTVLPMCNYFDEIGNYSLRSYSLAPRVTTQKVGICRAGSDGRSAPIPPYAGTCPPR